MILIVYGVLCYLLGCGTIAIFAGVRDAMDWFERDRRDHELRMINGDRT